MLLKTKLKRYSFVSGSLFWIPESFCKPLSVNELALNFSRKPHHFFVLKNEGKAETLRNIAPKLPRFPFTPFTHKEIQSTFQVLRYYDHNTKGVD